MGCLPSATSETELIAYFSQFSFSVDRLEIKYRKNSVCAGFGYLTCKLSKEQETQLLQQKHAYLGRELDVQPFLQKEALKSTKSGLYDRKVSVLNIPRSATLKQLCSLFECYGPVEKVYFGNCSKIQGPRKAFVIFKDKKAADRLLKARVLFKGTRLTIALISDLKTQKGSKKAAQNPLKEHSSKRK